MRIKRRATRWWRTNAWRSTRRGSMPAKSPPPTPHAACPSPPALPAAEPVAHRSAPEHEPKPLLEQAREGGRTRERESASKTSPAFPPDNKDDVKPVSGVSTSVVLRGHAKNVQFLPNASRDEALKGAAGGSAGSGQSVRAFGRVRGGSAGGRGGVGSGLPEGGGRGGGWGSSPSPRPNGGSGVRGADDHVLPVFLKRRKGADQERDGLLRGQLLGQARV